VRVAEALAALGGLLLFLRALDTIPHDRLGFGSGPSTQIAPGLLALATAAAVAVAAAVGRRRPAATAAWPSVPAVAIALLAVAAVSAQPLSDWLPSGAADISIERLWTATGVVIRQTTAPGTPVVMGAAGNIAYFDRRPGIDLLGKMDPVVAHGPPTTIAPIRYRPGHNKWNYAHSIGTSRPPVVAALWWPAARDLCDVARWGYRQIAPRFYIRQGARGVDVPRLAHAMRQLSATPSYPPPGAGCA
jgi:hypothetical protein